MADYSASRAVNKTLTATTVDAVTITGSAPLVCVHNRGTNTLWVRSGAPGTTVADPTSAGDNCIPVPAGTIVPVRDGGGGALVKVLGNGDAYSVFATAALPVRP